MASEISVVLQNLEENKIEMINLSDSLRSRSLSVSFANSKGETVTELKTLVEDVIILKSTLADLYDKTADLIESIATEFDSVDNKIATGITICARAEES